MLACPFQHTKSYNALHFLTECIRTEQKSVDTFDFQEYYKKWRGIISIMKNGEIFRCDKKNLVV